jgi:tRNA nucleotidyltransferase (CCA-adding enzyme)
MVLARYLYPDYTLVRSRLIHPVARNLYNLFQNHLDMLHSKELEHQDIENVVIVDTKRYDRIKEFFSVFGEPAGKITVYDHHTTEKSDVEGAIVYNRSVGSNTTLLGLQLIERGIDIDPEDATIALTGLYADTGNFTHDNVTHDDFTVGAYLIKSGASLTLVKKFLQTLKDNRQITLFHELLNNLSYADFNGHFIIVSCIELEQQTGGLAAVVEKVFEVENPDAIFAVFGFKKGKKSIIVARSQKENIDVSKLLAVYGGGGHTHAASALIRNRTCTNVFTDLEQHLRHNLLPAVQVNELMSRNVALLNENWSLMQASMFLENVDHTGAPVIDNDGVLVGFMTLKDIMKGRKSQQMHAPVKAYMSKKVITVRKNSTIRDVEHLLHANNIGHLPVTEDDEVIGIVTRWDYLNYLETNSRENDTSMGDSKAAAQ